MALRSRALLVPALASLATACSTLADLSGYELARPTTDAALETAVDGTFDDSVLDTADTSVPDTSVPDVAETSADDAVDASDTFVVDVPDAADTFVLDTADTVDTPETADTFVEDTFDADPCASVTCTMPPMPTCANSGTRRTFAATGTCTLGMCSYTSTDTPCPPSELCFSGLCMPPPSCGGGGPLLTCAGGESCCTSPLVTGGTFKRSYDGVSFTDGSYVATVSDFRLDKFEISVGRFRRFIKATVDGWKPMPGSGKHAHLNGGKGPRGTGRLRDRLGRRVGDDAPEHDDRLGVDRASRLCAVQHLYEHAGRE